MYTIDLMIHERLHMPSCLSPSPFCVWYVWNAEVFDDPHASKLPEYASKDKGLVFQAKLADQPWWKE